MADGSWVDSLSEEWISQPRSESSLASHSPIGSLNSNPSGSTRVLHERNYTNTSTTNRHARRRNNETLGSISNSYGTTQLHNNKRRSDTPEWKRKLMEDFGPNGGGKDLFSPMQLENIFRPPTIGPNSTSSPLLLPQPQKQQPPVLTESPRMAYLSTPHASALSTLAEEAGSGSAHEPTKPNPPRREADMGTKPVLLPLTHQSLLAHSLRRTHSSPPGQRVSDNLERTRKAEGYAGVEQGVRSKNTRPELPQTRKPSIRMARPAPRWLAGRLRHSSDDVRNEIISLVSVGELRTDSSCARPYLRRGTASNPECRQSYSRDEDEEEDEYHKEQPYGLGRLPSESESVGRFTRPDPDCSVYPSSPPIPEDHHHYLPRREHYGDDDDDYDDCGPTDEEDDENHMEDTQASLIISPKKPPPTPPSPEKKPMIRDLAPHSDPHGSGLLRNIRNHKDAPKSPIKTMGVTSSQYVPTSSDGEDDPFFMPHPFRNSSAPPLSKPATADSQVQRNKNSGSPLKLFSGAYDTYTTEKLRIRLGELEESEAHEESLPNRTLSFNGEIDDESEAKSEHDYSGGSIVVNRLEAMAREIEKQDSPPGVKYVRRHSKMVQYREMTEEEIMTTTTTKIVGGGHQRHQSSPQQPIPSPSSNRKHRRWRSDESSVAPSDGVAGPRNPVKERTPKRARRGTVVVTPRPGSSGTPNHYFQSPATGRRRIYAGIEEGSILASSRRQQRSRANSKESQASVRTLQSSMAMVVTESPSPMPRKKKQHIMRDSGQLVVAPALNSRNGASRARGLRKITFSGSKGDGMQGESFEMPTPSRRSHPGMRKGSVTTQDFLEQAEAVMARLRRKGTQSDSDDEEDLSPPNTRKNSYESNAADDDDTMYNDSSSQIDERSTSMRLHAVAIKLNGCNLGKFPGMDDRQEDLGVSRSSRSSRTSVRVISNVPEVLAHHLATKTANDMTFDKATLAWVSRTPTKDSEDPLRDISDLSVDSKEEERVLRLAREEWGTSGPSAGVEQNGIWRSSRAVDERDLKELRESTGADTWDEYHWGRSQPLSSSVGSGSSRRSNGSGFGLHSRTGTRTTSYGTDENVKDVKETEMAQHDNRNDEVREDRDDKKIVAEKKPSARFVDDSFASSPLKHEMKLDGDDKVDGFLDHGSLRQPGRSTSFIPHRNSARRKSIGKSFIGRPVSRITEEEETSYKFQNPDLDRDFGRLSLSSALTPMQTPFKNKFSALPPVTTKNKPEVSFFLSPLPDLSYRFESTEALISLELSYITARRGPKATPKAVEASFSIARDNLLKHLTDVEPYNPYWDFIRCLKLTERKLETLHTLNEWCPRITDLDVSRNELGQLSGVPDSVLSLNAQRNCLSNVTFFGHLTNLQYLDVSGNGLQSLEALRACIHLREVKADDNALTRIDGVFALEGLMSLRCRRNRLESVDFSTCELTRLAELDLRGNCITEVFGLEDLPSLVHLNLDQNRLTTLNIPPNLKLTTIRSIKLTHNAFSTFDVAPFPSLRILYMDNNKLSHVDGLTRAKSIDAVSFRDQATAGNIFSLDITRMYEARKLYLSSNPIGVLSLRSSFLNLQFLELAGCQLKTLPKNLSTLIPNMRVLNLNNNALSDLRPLAGLSRLVKLLCAGNRVVNLKRLRQALSKCRGLKWVDFRSNPVTLGFYPQITAVARTVEIGEEYVKDPFEIVDADAETDRGYEKRMDLQSRCERRRYWLMVAGVCRKVRGVDGLVFEREVVEGEDEVWRECVRRGWVVVDQGRSGGGGGKCIDARSD